MARNPLMPRRRTVTGFTVWFLFLIAPDLLRLHPSTAPLADAVSWLDDMVIQGVVSAVFFIAVWMACSLVYDACQWLTGRDTSAAESSPPPALTVTPAELEEGAGAAMRAYRLAVLEAEVTGASPPPPPPSTSTTTSGSAATQATIGRKILHLGWSTGLFTWQFLRHQVVSLERPALENLWAAALYILHGLGAVVVFGLFVMGMAWWKRQRQAEADTTPAEVLFEGTLPDEEQLETLVKKENEISEKESVSNGRTSVK